MPKLFSPLRLFVTGLVLIGVAFAVLWFVPSGTYIFLPDRAHPVAPFVSVRGEHPPKNGGGIYYVDVLVRKATLFERLFPSIRTGSTLVPAQAFNPPGYGDRQLEIENARQMRTSQEVAAAVALRSLGFRVRVRRRGVLVDDVVPGAPAAGKLLPTDVIVAVDGHRVQTPADLRRLISRHRPGERVRLGVRSGAGLRTVLVRTASDPQDRSRSVVGIFVTQGVDIKLPFPVRFDLGSVGGPSAGLAFALDLVEELGHDIDHGQRVAATGELMVDGSVHRIGGVKQKALGALRSHVDIFLVPAGDNAREARRYAHGLHVVPVKSFRQALRALKTLAPNA